MPGASSAADWHFAPYLELAETYTDNVTLQASAQAESDRVTEVNPGFSLTSQGRELQLSFGYRMQNLFYANDSRRDNVNHQMQAQAHGIVAPEWLFLDANASLSQQVLSPSDSVSFGNIASAGNREDVLSTSVSPNIQMHLGPSAVSTLRYTQSQVKYSGSTTAITEDSVTDSIDAQIRAAHPLGAWTWSMDALKEDIQYSKGRADESRKNIVMNFGYRLSYRFQLTGMIGREDNQYATLPGAPATQGNSWNSGLVWTPSPRTTMTLGVGHRYFGSTKNLNFSHRGRRNDWQLSYLDDLFSRRQSQLHKIGDFPVNNPDTQLPEIRPFYELLTTEEVFIRHRSEFQWKVHARKLTFSSRMFFEKREFQLSGEDERIGGGDMGWEWRVSRYSNINVDWGRQGSSQVGSADTYRYAGLGWERKLGPNAVGSIDLHHTIRDSTVGGSGYEENLVTGRLRMTW